MDKVRIGVVGVGRGSTMINFCEKSGNAQLVAICDKWEDGLMRKKAELNDESIFYYTSFEEFLKHDMDAVVLANYANEHAPFAIKVLESGKHVISEVLPAQTLKEAVELVDAIEKTGKIYAYAENYCFMGTPREMRKLYRQGVLGEFEYGEGEYVHNCESIWPDITYGDPDHWRNNMFVTYYCTHSVGPLLHITGLRPVKVSGFELPFNPRIARMGRKTGSAGIEMVTLENGAVIKSIHGDLDKNSIWYTIYGSKGRMESAREDAECGAHHKIYINCDSYEGESKWEVKSYEPEDELSKLAESYGHGGSDFYTMWNFIKKIRGNEDADTIDIYEALDMSFPGIFAYRSVLNGGISMDIPDFRNKAVREQYRNDVQCSDAKVAGDQLLPSYSKGNPMIPDEVYENTKQKWLKSLEKK